MSLRSAGSPVDRPTIVRKALRLEYFTVGWNLIEGVVAVAAALASGSVVLLGFGLDSFVECASAGVLVWRLRAEHGMKRVADVERIDRKAHRLVAATLFGLAAYISFDSLAALISRERPEPTPVGIVLTMLSIGLMIWLARAKRRAAAALRSRALEADAFQTTACWWISVAALAGLGLNAVWGWWWADPLAALVLAGLIVSEAREAWRGEECRD